MDSLAQRFRRPISSRPSSPPRMRFQGALLVLIGVCVGLALGGPSGLTASSSPVDQEAFRTFEQVWDLIHDEYVLPGEIDDVDLLYGAARGMVEALGDTGHSVFLDPDSARDFRASIRGELIGIGVELDLERAEPIVTNVLTGSPAERAGIEIGDQIIAVDGRETSRLSSIELRSAIRGAEGTSVTLRIFRPATDEIVEVVLTRARIDIDPVSWGMLPGRIAFVRLTDFSLGASDRLREVLADVRDRNARGIVLDLRGNPGGLVTEAIGVASELMPEGSVLYQHQPREGSPRPVRTIDVAGLATDLPLVVLVDRRTASAGEILAAALRDAGRAEVVGERTFGTATVVSSFELDDGSIAALGTALWLTPSGEVVRNVGVEPTIDAVLAPGDVPLRIDDGRVVSSLRLAESGDEPLLIALDVLLAAVADDALAA